MLRNKDIDNLRGLAMIAMMLIHAASYYLKTKGIYLLWNYLQWAVPVFLFCSFYISLKNDKPIDYLKRLKRLFIPYWMFLLAYFFLLFFFENKNFNFQYLTANILLYKGIDFNWLVLLFFYFTFLLPFYKWIKEKKLLYYLMFFLSLASSLLFIFTKPIAYRIIMWLPWMLYFYFTEFIINNEVDKKNHWRINFLAIISFFIFIGIFFLENYINRNTSQYANKYPPTLFHLTFGMFSTIIFYQMSKQGFFGNFLIRKVLDFFSKNSYSLYFIHILVMLISGWTGMIWKLNWFSFFLLIVGLSSGIFLLIQSSRSVFLSLRNRF